MALYKFNQGKINDITVNHMPLVLTVSGNKISIRIAGDAQPFVEALLEELIDHAGAAFASVAAFITYFNTYYITSLDATIEGDVNVDNVGIEDVAGDQINPAKEDGNLKTISDQVDATTGLKVRISDGSGNQITEFGGADVDDAAFTAGVSKGTVMMGVVTTDEVDSGDKGALKMDTSRQLHVRDDTVAGLLRTVPAVWGEVYASPQDFTATYASSTSVTITGAPFTVDDANCYVFKILYKPTAGAWTCAGVNGHNGVSIIASSGTVTITGAGTPFAAGDTYRVIVLGQKKAYDVTNDVNKVSEASPLWSRYAGPETILSASQAFTASWVDLESGYEIDCRGYNRLILYAVVDHTDGANYRFRALGKHTASGSDEYVLPIKNVGTSDVQVEGHLYELNTDVDQSVILDWDVTGIPYVQLQIQVGTIGSGTAAVTSAVVTKAY